MNPFDELHPALRYHLVNTLGWTELRPTQLAAIMPVQSGDNAILLAPTAGGKTEAAAFPLLSRMAREGWRGLSALYVCPLRALLNNLEPRLQRYASFVGRRAALWHGDLSDAARRHILHDPPDLLLTTPESLEAMMISPRVDVTVLLGDVRGVVVDELHAFAGDDRGWHLLFLLGRVEHLSGRQLQRIGLTATVGNPEEMLVWLARGRGGQAIGPSEPTTDGEVTADYVGSLANAVTVLARVFRGERRLVFAESRSRVEQITEGLRTAESGLSLPTPRCPRTSAGRRRRRSPPSQTAPSSPPAPWSLASMSGTSTASCKSARRRVSRPSCSEWGAPAAALAHSAIAFSLPPMTRSCSPHSPLPLSGAKAWWTPSRRPPDRRTFTPSRSWRLHCN